MGDYNRNTHELPLEPKTASRPTFRDIEYAQQAVEFLIDRGGFFTGSKAQFALTIGWFNHLARTGPNTEPDRRRVETVCNITRDQHTWPDVAEILGGYVVAYAPSQGGMTLVDPQGEQPLDHLLHLLAGDMQRQQATKTVNRRRLPTWRAAGDNAAKNEDSELARLCWQAEHDINKTGFVSDTQISELFKALRSRGLLEEAAS